MRYTNILTLGIGLGLTIGVIAVGCSATSTESTFGNTGGSSGTETGGAAGQAGAGGQGGGASTGGAGGAGGDGGSIIFPMDDGGPPPLMPGEVYGHSSGTLFKLEPYSQVVTTIGPFNGCSSVIDLAIDKDSKIIATTFDGIYWVDKTNAKCTLIAQGGYPNSLSFVPEGILDPVKEVLVGYQNSTYVRIDTTSGQIAQLGSIGNGYYSSGDIVSVKGGGTYLTVKGNECGDCLFEVNPKTGAMIKNWGATGFNSVFGIAYWAGTVYGFTNDGQLFEMKFINNQTLVTTEIPIPNAPNGLSFWGAGSTTIAPIVPPPK
jgi:hypothetical protein